MSSGTAPECERGKWTALRTYGWTMLWYATGRGDTVSGSYSWENLGRLVV